MNKPFALAAIVLASTLTLAAAQTVKPSDADPPLAPGGANFNRFHEYVGRERHPSYAYDRDIAPGMILPDEGVRYYEVPQEYSARGYNYTIVNGRTVLVEPRTRRVIQMFD